jgi:hypothetical protein
MEGCARVRGPGTVFPPSFFSFEVDGVDGVLCAS